MGWASLVWNLGRLAIGCVLVLAGTFKLLLPNEFRDALEVHGVLSPTVISMAPMLGVVEVGIGIAWLVVVDTAGPRLLQLLSLAGSGVLSLTFAVYVFLTPNERLMRAGCGCFGTATHKLVTALDVPTRAVALSVDGMLLLGASWGLARWATRRGRAFGEIPPNKRAA